VFQSKCLRRIYKVHWPYIISNDELLKRGQTQRWSEVMPQRRWSWIGHVLRMDHSSHWTTALTWTPEGTRKVGRPRGGEQWKKKGSNSDGHHGAKPECKHRTEAIGIIVSRPYAPAGAKKEGEDIHSIWHKINIHPSLDARSPKLISSEKHSGADTVIHLYLWCTINCR